MTFGPKVGRDAVDGLSAGRDAADVLKVYHNSSKNVKGN